MEATMVQGHQREGPPSAAISRAHSRFERITKNKHNNHPLKDSKNKLQRLVGRIGA